MAKACPKCGISDLKDDSLFCIQCGARLSSAKSELNNISEAEKLKIEIEESLSDLKASGNIQLIRNFIDRYPNFDSRDQNFSNLNALLSKKGSNLTNFELLAVIVAIKEDDQFEYVKTRILHNNPKSSDECVKNYLEIFGVINKSYISDSERKRYKMNIDGLTRILKEQFDYHGNLASDFLRIEKEIQLEKFENSITGNQYSRTRITIDDIDRISGYDFEIVLKTLFKKMGYHVIHTPLSGDQGADLIVEKFGVKTVVQAKNWQNNVTNSGIQEIVAAVKHFDAQRAMVISTSGFTQSARDLARSNKVVLWDRSILITMLDENPLFRT